MIPEMTTAVAVRLELLVERTQLAAVELERLLSDVAGVELEDGLVLADRELLDAVWLAFRDEERESVGPADLLRGRRGRPCVGSGGRRRRL
jgi:hypothetical protein